MGLIKNMFGKRSGENSGMIKTDTVEGTDQCRSCQRFMVLGDGRLCLTVTGDDLKIAEIVGWLPGRCDHFLKAVDPFEPETAEALPGSCQG